MPSDKARKNVKRRRVNPAHVHPFNLTKEDAFGMLGSALGYQLGRELSKVDTDRPPDTRYKFKRAIMVKAQRVCLRCSNRRMLIAQPGNSPADKKYFGRRCPMCGGFPHAL